MSKILTLTPEELKRERLRELKRSRRQRSARAYSIQNPHNHRELERLRAENEPAAAELEAARPKRRLECINGARPCPFVGCRHNLYLDASERTGSIKLNFPDLEPDEMPPEASCALDVAEQGGLTLEQLGVVMNLTRERARQLEALLLRRLEGSVLVRHLDDGFAERMGWSSNEVPDVF